MGVEHQMEKWEYKAETVPPADLQVKLDELGEEGYELVVLRPLEWEATERSIDRMLPQSTRNSVTAYTLVMKRRKP
jgi:hypothetical protein